jgi:hypothetical protein
MLCILTYIYTYLHRQAGMIGFITLQQSAPSQMTYLNTHTNACVYIFLETEKQREREEEEADKDDRKTKWKPQPLILSLIDS